jgi:hypothetical protein
MKNVEMCSKKNRSRLYIAWVLSVLLLVEALWSLPTKLRTHTAKPFTDVIITLTLVVACFLGTLTQHRKLNCVIYIILIAWLLVVAMY